MAEICFACGNRSVVKKQGDFHFYPPDNIPGGVMIVKDTHWEQCEECGEKFLSSELDLKLEQIAKERTQSQ